MDSNLFIWIFKIYQHYFTVYVYVYIYRDYRHTVFYTCHFPFAFVHQWDNVVALTLPREVGGSFTGKDASLKGEMHHLLLVF